MTGAASTAASIKTGHLMLAGDVGQHRVSLCLSLAHLIFS